MSEHIKTETHFFSTYAGLMLRPYSVLSRIIQRHGGGNEAETLVSGPTFAAAISGSYGPFIQETLQHYSIFNQFAVALHLSQDPFFKGQQTETVPEFILPAHLKNFPLLQLSSLQNKLEVLLESQHNQYTTELLKWHATLLSHLHDSNPQLLNKEVQYFKTEILPGELEKALGEQNLHPDNKLLQTDTLSRYFQLKTLLLLSRSYAAQGITQTLHTLLSHLETLNPSLAQIKEQATKLLSQHKEAREEAIKPILWKTPEASPPKST